MIKYNINKEKRTVVAYFEGNYDYWNECLSYILVDKLQDKLFLDYNLVTDIVNKVLDGRILYGKAICAEEDEWDEYMGKRIAKRRLLDRWDAAVDKMLDYYSQVVDEQYNNLTDRINSTYRSIPF